MKDDSILGMIGDIGGKPTNGGDRGTMYADWVHKVLKKQKYKCSGKNCAKMHNGKRMPVGSNRDIDHKRALKLGGKHILSNLQALCPNCHSEKTKEDRRKIAQSKKRGVRGKINTNPFAIKPLNFRF